MKLVLERASTILKLVLFGPPAIEWADIGLSIPRRQTRALLYRLAAQTAPIARAQLCYLFWPDLPDVTARRNLTHLLTLLRRALPDTHLLQTDGESVALDPERSWSDLRAFSRLLQSTSPQTRTSDLLSALELYRGPLLDGFALADCPEYESWIDQERQAWERRVDDTLAAILEARTAARDYAGAIAVAQQALTRDPLAEEIHRRLIALYGTTGDRAAALRQYEHCAVTLERELGVSPLPETHAVYQAARDGEALLPPPHDATTAADTQRAALEIRPRHRDAVPINARSSVIPAPASSLIGREAVLAEILAQISRPAIRLLTLAGSGGSGKTRLALQAARLLEAQFTDGAAFVTLAPLRDPALVPQAIADTLGLGERDERAPLARLQAMLRTRELLLVLDNVEHVVTAAPDIAALLAAAPQVKVLVTSRELLRIAGEQVYGVPPLALPDPLHLPPLNELAEIGAVALFLARVRERVPDFTLTESNAADIAAICGQLDGLPLAIELAAARAALLSPRMLLARLDRRTGGSPLQLLAGGARDLPERQRTLRATIDWSYNLLDVGEQLLLGRLAVFAGGWTLDAAEQVAEAVGPLAISVLDGLHALLDKHLVLGETGSDGEPRYTMLETIREYALERLDERGERALTLAAHADYVCTLASAAAPLLHGPEQIDWFNRLEDEHANLRGALSWLLKHDQATSALALSEALAQFWYVRGHFGEGQSWFRRALQAAPAPSDQADKLRIARVRQHLGTFTLMRGDLRTAQQLLRPLVRDLDDLEAHHGPSEALRRVQYRARQRLLQADGMINSKVDQADVEYLVSLGRSLNDPHARAEHLLHFGRAMLYGAGQPALARQEIEQAEPIFRKLGDVLPITMLTADLGMLAMFDGDLELARSQFRKARVGATALHDRYLEAEIVHNLGEVARLAGDDAAAEEYYQISRRLYRQLGSRAEPPRIIHNLAYLALHRGDLAQARSLFCESLREFGSIGQPRGQFEVVAGLAAVAAASGQALLAARLWGNADTLHRSFNATPWPSDRAERARYEPLARIAIDEHAFAAAYAAGEQLSLEQAVSESQRV